MAGGAAFVMLGLLYEIGVFKPPGLMFAQFVTVAEAEEMKSHAVDGGRIFHSRADDGGGGRVGAEDLHAACFVLLPAGDDK